jgi:hypothetical protein
MNIVAAAAETQGVMIHRTAAAHGSATRLRQRNMAVAEAAQQGILIERRSATDAGASTAVAAVVAVAGAAMTSVEVKVVVAAADTSVVS